MVVEDSVDVAETLRIQLKQWGCSCQICASDSEALALAPSFEPQVVLRDIGLPDMDGWEVARRLPSGSLLIAITSYGEAGDFQRSQSAGIAYHLVKPAFQNQLRELLGRVIAAAGFDEYLVQPVPFEQISELHGRVEAKIAPSRALADRGLKDH